MPSSCSPSSGPSPPSSAATPWLAGLIGAAATAARPLGVVLVVGVGRPHAGAARRLRGPVRDADSTEAAAQQPTTPGWRGRLARLRPGDCGVLLAAVGLAGYGFYLWRRFDDPLAFLTIQSAWGQQEGPATWFKVDFFREMARFESVNACIVLAVNAAVTVVAVALLPRVVRRFGWGYGTFTILIVGLSALSTKNFTGMGRYLLAAFPCFAVAAELLDGTGSAAALGSRLQWRGPGGSGLLLRPGLLLVLIL